jgi:hypothetical protein
MTERPREGESFLEPDEEDRPADEPTPEELREREGGGEKPDVPPGSGLRPTTPG